MKFVLPKLDQLVLKDLKANEDDVRKFVHVINGHAIIQNGIVAIVDIRAYVKRECKIEDDDDFAELKTIIDWLNGKSFTASFWKELTAINYVSLMTDGLKIENVSYNKILEYEDIITDTDIMVQSIHTGLTRQAITTDRTAIGGAVVDRLNSVFKKEMKSDAFIFDFAGKENSIKFQAQKQEHIFGLIPVDYNASCEITSFLSVKDFASTLLSNSFQD